MVCSPVNNSLYILLLMFKAHFMYELRLLI